MSARTKSRQTLLLANVTIPTVPAPAHPRRGGHDRDRRHFAGRLCP